MCEEYLSQYHKEFIINCMENADEKKHFSLNINFLQLFDNDPNLGAALLENPESNLDEWDKAITKVQTTILLDNDNKKLIFKPNIHCRIHQLPRCPELYRTIFPKNEDVNNFLAIRGTVVRMTSIKMLEYKRQYICSKCKYSIYVNAQYELKNAIIPPKKCTNPEVCHGTNFICGTELDGDCCKDYQEVKLQENVSNLDSGCIPNSMWISLEDDLVDICKPGDNITVSGIVKRRWGQLIPGKLIDIDLVIKANHVQVNNNNMSKATITPELKHMFEGFWKTYAHNPLIARDIILKSICPQIFGLYLVKLAIAVVIAGGSQTDDNSNTGTRTRSEAHLLMVGDPGTGKSQLLKFASKIVLRSVLTTGVGSTAAGLTASAFMENGEWQLEGGALVLADGGICCIDEFNSMKQHDRTSIHEAMEQQTISVAKASIVCKLNTRCSILAATNPKGNLDLNQPLCLNVALASPLLSRFDLVLLLKDNIKDDWDSLVVDHILNFESDANSSKLGDNINWTIETLQAYYAVIKKLNPVLTEDSNKILASYYQAQRRKDYRNKSRTTVRLLDSLVRLSQGHARLMHHSEVQIVDAVVAVSLVETAMEAEYSLFNLRFNLQSDFPANPTDGYRELLEIILKKLNLNELLEKELEAISNIHSGIEISVASKTEKKPLIKTESKYFNVASENSRNKTNNNSKSEMKDNEPDEIDTSSSPSEISQNKKEIRQENKDLVESTSVIEEETLISSNLNSNPNSKVVEKNKQKELEKTNEEDKVMTDIEVLNLLDNKKSIFETDSSDFCNADDLHLCGNIENKDSEFDNSSVLENMDMFNSQQVQACSTFIEPQKREQETRDKPKKETSSKKRAKISDLSNSLKRFKFVPREKNSSAESSLNTNSENNISEHSTKSIELTQNNNQQSIFEDRDDFDFDL